MPPRKRAAPPAVAALVPMRTEPEPITETTTTKGGKVKVNVLGYKPHAKQPVVIGRNLERIDGARAAQRPCAIARRAKKKSITELEWADEYE